MRRCAQCGIPQSSVSLSHDVMNNARRILHFSQWKYGKCPLPIAENEEKKNGTRKMPATTNIGRRATQRLGTWARARAYVHFVQFMLHWILLFIFIYFLRVFAVTIFAGDILCPIGRQLRKHAPMCAGGKDNAFRCSSCVHTTRERKRAEEITRKREQKWRFKCKRQ